LLVAVILILLIILVFLFNLCSFMHKTLTLKDYMTLLIIFHNHVYLGEGEGQVSPIVDVVDHILTSLI